MRLLFAGLLLIACLVILSFGYDLNRNGHYKNPAYSPDGTKIAYLLNEQVIIADKEGLNRKRVTGGLFSEGRVEDLAWLPDGKLAYVKVSQGDKPMQPKIDLVLYNPRTGKSKLIKEDLGPTSSLTWNLRSANVGSWIMSSSKDTSNPGRRQIYLYNMKTDDLELVPKDTYEDDFEEVRWFPDGKKLAYIQKGTLFALDLGTGSTIMNRNDQENISNFAISPDGQWILYRRLPDRSNDYKEGVYVISSDFSKSPSLLTKEIHMVTFDWSPNGKSIVYTTVGKPGKNGLKFFEVSASFQ